MYFNRKNAEQKNWRMIKKGKHFLFGCSLVFAVGASLATQVVHANTAETNVANNSTTGDVNPTQNGDGKTYEAPAAVAEIKSEVATTPAVAEKLDGETAKEVKALDKTKLENYIAEIEAKLANGTYDNKTEESVAVLKADLEAAKATLANATTQDEITKAYNKLVTTANTKLKNKPVEKKETPAVDTTNGKETVGKKAENTEKKSESNSIENTGSNDPRNNQRIPAGIQFRAEVAVSEDTNAAPNGHSDTYILNDVNRQTDPSEAARITSRVTNYKVKYHKDSNGKITSLDWLVYFNNYSENIPNTYHTDAGELYRNYIQIPKEVNMPDTITRAQYASPRNGKLNPVTRRLERDKPNGQPVSASSTFENPTPDRASGLPREGLETFNLADWPNGGKGRYIENLSTQLPRYFKDAASDSSPGTRDILRAAAINGDRLIVDRSTTGGSSYNSYVWSFTTTVPNDTTNEQLKDMKVVFGMMRSATAGANAAFANVAANPVKMWQSDVSPEPTAKDQTVKVGQKPDATKSIGNLDTLPKGTTVKYKDAVDTRTPGEKRATAVVTYPDTSTKEVPVKVIVEKEKEAVAPAKPVITTSLTGKANTKTPVEVKAEAGSTVSLFAKDGTKLGTGVANDKGVASITPTVNIPAGNVAATATKNGKTSEVSDAVVATPAAVTPQPETPKPSAPAPDAATNKPAAGAATNNPAATPTTSGPEIVNDLAGKASTPADVTIKAPAGSTVKLYNTDGVVIGEAVANDQGVATVHPTNSLPEGEITATSTPAGGTESAKSAPITVTKTPLTIIDGGVTGNNDTRLLVSKETITVYPGDKIDVDVVAQATALEKFSVEKNPTAIKGVLPSGGYLGSSNGATINQRDAKYSGTVAMDQPAGTNSIVFHASNRDKPTTIYRELKVIVLETAKKYEPVAGTKVDIADSNGVSETEKNKIIEAVKSANPSLPANSQYSVDEKGNLTITYPDGSKDKIAAAYLVNPATPTKPVINTDLAGKAKTKTPVEVTADAGATVELFDKEGNSLGTGVANAQGVARITPTKDIPAGNVTAKATKNGKTSEVSDRKVATPVVPEKAIAQPTKEGDKSVKVAVPAAKPDNVYVTIQGKATNLRLQPDGTYAFVKNDANATVVNNPDGSLTLTLPEGKTLNAGDRIVTRTQNDDPSKSVGSVASAEDQTYPQLNQPEKVTVADSKNLTDAEKTAVKAAVKKANPSVVESELTVDNQGNVTYKHKGAGVNVASEIATLTLTDTVKVATTPTKPVINTDLTGKAKTKTPVEVTADPGTTVELFDKDGNKIGEAVAGENGKTTITPTKDIPAGNVTAKATKNGKTSEVSDRKVATPVVPEKAIAQPTKEGDKSVTVAVPASKPDTIYVTVQGKPTTLRLQPDGTYNFTKNDANATLVNNPDGTVTLNLPEGKTLNAGDRIVTRTQNDDPSNKYGAVASQEDQTYPQLNQPEKVPVADSKNLTDAEKAAVKAAVKKATPSVVESELEVDGQGNVTYKHKGAGVNVPSEIATLKLTDTVTTDTEAPAKPVVKTDLTGKAKTTTPVEVTTEPGAKVELFDKDGNKIGEATADDKGLATITPDKPIPAGNVTAKATDKAGNVSEASDVVKATPVVPEKAPAQPTKEGDKSVTVAVPASKPDTIYVTVQGKATTLRLQPDGTYNFTKNDANATLVNNPDGTVTLNLPEGKTLNAGDRIVTRTQNDDPSNRYGAVASAEDQTYPQLNQPEKVTVADSKNLTDAEKTAVKAAVKKANPSVVESELEVDGQGNVTYKHKGAGVNVPSEIATLKLTDTVTTDTEAPAKPVVKTDLTGKAKTTTPVEVTTEPGAKVELFDKDGNKIGEATADDKGLATITPDKPIPAGNVTAKATDKAGNVSEASDVVKATPAKDTENPSTPDTAAPAKPEVKTDLTGKAGTKDPVEVTAEPGSKVELFDKDGKKIGEGVAGKDGKATITPTEALPAGDVTAKATDPAGNVSEPSVPAKATPAKDTEDPSTKDTDGDGLTDKEEAEKGTDPKKADTDGDGLTDKEEVEKGTDPKKADTDGDGLTDKEEAAKGTDPKKADTDGDGLTDKEEAEKGTDPKKADTDGDGLTDKEEAEKGTDPKKADTDGDGFTDKEEVAKGTDPKDPNSKPESKPENPSTPDTAAPAKPEVKTDLTGKAGTKDPVEVTAEPGSKVELFDKDGKKIGEGVAGKDGKATITPTEALPAGDVTAKATDPAGNVSEPSVPAKATPAKDTEDPSTKDTDGDGLTDKEEAEKGTDPKKADTDGDGFTDKEEVAKGTDPKDPNSKPESKPENPSTPDTAAPAKPEVKTDLTGKAGTKDPVEVTAEPGSKVELFDKDGKKIGEGVAGKDGKATITPTEALPAGDVTAKATDPAGNVSEPSVPAKATPAKDADGVKDPAKTPVKDPANLTDAEKAKVADEVKKANPTAKDVEVGKDGTTTVTFPDGSKAEIPAAKAAEKAKDATPAKDADGVKDPAKTPVKDPANLTDAEKAKVADEVKKANPTAKDVEVGKDGTTTVTFPDGSKAEIPAAKAAEKAKDATPAKDADGVKDPAKTPVKDPANLTDAEKAKVADEVKKANPTAKDVEVGKDGTTTVTFPDGSKAEIPAAKAAEKAKDATPAKDADGVKDPEAKTPVKDPANLTDAEKAKVADEVKKANPTAKDVEVGKDGTTTVTFPDGSKAEIPAAKAAEKAKDATPAKDADGVKDPEAKTPVKDPANLTDAEKAKVAEEVKKANPTAKDVEVGKDGTATVTFPDGSKAEIPAAKAAEKAKDATPAKDADGVKDPAKTPVKDPANLTDAEKAKVVDEVKKANPTAKDVEVGKDGTTTVTFPDGSKAEIPAAKAAEKAKDATPAKDADGVKDPAKTPVKDPANLTDAEKAKVADEVKKANPTAKDVEVGKDGTTTVTFPDGSKAEIPAAKAAEKAKDATPAKDADGVKDPEAKTPVKDPANLTDAEKAKVADEVKKANPTAKDVEVGKDGTTTVTFPDGSKAEIPAAKAAEKAKDATPAKDADGVKDPEAKTPVKDPANLTDAEKAKVAEEVKKANPTAKDVEVGKDGTATVTFPDGSKAEIPAAKAAEKAKDATPAKDADGVKDPAKTPVKDPANLTDAEKAKVVDEVKKANPTAKDVEVGKDGTTTVTFPDGSKAEIPAAKAAEKAKDATPAKDADGVKDPEAKTPVKDPANLTDAEKAKVADEVKKANPTAKDVEVGKDGTTTVTFPDGSKAEIPAAKAAEKAKDATPAKDADGVKDPEAKTPVKDPANLTDAEKAKVAEEVKKANPTAKDVEVGKDGTATVTFPDGSKAEIPAAKAAEKAKDATPAKDADGVKDPAKTPVKDPANLTDAEKAKVADEVKKANPTAKDVEVGKDGTTTVTFPDGSKAEIPAAKAAEKAKDATPAKDADGVKDPEAKTPVKDPANLTDAEKAKVADEVKKSNPTVTDVKVGKDGTTTVTFPDGSTAVIPSGDAVKKSSDNVVKDPAVTPVVDPSNLTEAEKAKVADEVKKSNPTVTDVKVGKDGTTTVTFPDGSTAVIPSGDAVKKSSDNVVKDPAVTPVVDPSNLTEAEKAKVADEVKKSNPTVTDVKVGKDGTTTVTFPDGSTAVIPSGDAVKKSSDNVVKDPAVTPVVDPSNLTEAEKAKVADEVKKANPTVTDVKVGKDGTTTVTFPDGSTAVIPSGDAVKKSSDNAVKDPAVTPVVDPSNLTEAEKAKVADEVKKSNPTVTDVKVGKDGTTTVTFPDGSTAVIPSGDTVKKSSDNAVKDPAVTPVVDPSNLTEAEKAKVADEVKKANPTVTDVKVGKDGTTTVTFPDGSTAVIPSGDTVKKSNPTATDVNVGKNGTTAVIPAAKADDMSKDADGVKDPSVTPVVDPSNLTDTEKAKVAEAVKKANPTATDVKVGKDGTTTVTFPDGSTAVIPAAKAVTSAEQGSHAVAPAAKAVTSAEQGSHATTPAKKAGAKELPNTGTADSTVAMVAAAASALLGLGLAGRRRKEDEEA